MRGDSVEVGMSADLVLLNVPSPLWAIIGRATRMVVIKYGTIVAEDGSFLGSENSV